MKLDELRPGDSFTGFYILKNVFNKVTNTGKPYLACSLADASRMVEAKVWDYSGPVGPADEGKVVKIQGQMQEYKGAPQVKVERIRLATDQDSYDLSLLVPVAPMDLDGAYARVAGLIETLEDADYRAVCLEFLRRHGEGFRRMPAAKSVHHGFVGGLLMHTSYMLEMAEFLARLYAEVIDRSLLLAGTLLHDIAKLEEFAALAQEFLKIDADVPGAVGGVPLEQVADAALVNIAAHQLIQPLRLIQHGEEILRLPGQIGDLLLVGGGGIGEGLVDLAPHLLDHIRGQNSFHRLLLSEIRLCNGL